MRPNKKLTIGAISKPKTAIKFVHAAAIENTGRNITKSEKIKQPLHIIANLDKNDKMELNWLIYYQVI